MRDSAEHAGWELNHQLNASAFSLGQIVGGGGLTEAEVVAALMLVAKDVKLDCDNDKVTAKATKACRTTINSGLSKGMLKPRTARKNINAKPAAGADEATADRELSVALTDFFSHMQTHSYIYVPTREMWPASSVNSRIPPVPVLNALGKKVRISANSWLDKNRPVEQMSWAPGEPLTSRTA